MTTQIPPELTQIISEYLEPKIPKYAVIVATIGANKQCLKWFYEIKDIVDEMVSTYNNEVKCYHSTSSTLFRWSPLFKHMNYCIYLQKTQKMICNIHAEFIINHPYSGFTIKLNFGKTGDNEIVTFLSSNSTSPSSIFHPSDNKNDEGNYVETLT